MKAARFYGNRDIRVEEIDVPQIRDGQVLVEIEWCGICGSDLHEYLVGETRSDSHCKTEEKTLTSAIRSWYHSDQRQAPSFNWGILASNHGP